MRLLRQAGFEVTLWQDRSDALKIFTAELILAYGSLSDFWRASGA